MMQVNSIYIETKTSHHDFYREIKLNVTIY